MCVLIAGHTYGFISNFVFKIGYDVVLDRERDDGVVHKVHATSFATIGLGDIRTSSNKVLLTHLLQSQHPCPAWAWRSIPQGRRPRTCALSHRHLRQFYGSKSSQPQLTSTSTLSELRRYVLLCGGLWPSQWLGPTCVVVGGRSP
jgi:hypothetical protein